MGEELLQCEEPSAPGTVSEDSINTDFPLPVSQEIVQQIESLMLVSKVIIHIDIDFPSSLIDGPHLLTCWLLSSLSFWLMHIASAQRFKTPKLCCKVQSAASRLAVTENRWPLTRMLFERELSPHMYDKALYSGALLKGAWKRLQLTLQPWDLLESTSDKNNKRISFDVGSRG